MGSQVRKISKIGNLTAVVSGDRDDNFRVLIGFESSIFCERSGNRKSIRRTLRKEAFHPRFEEMLTEVEEELKKPLSRDIMERDVLAAIGMCATTAQSIVEKTEYGKRQVAAILRDSHENGLVERVAPNTYILTEKGLEVVYDRSGIRSSPPPGR